MNETQLALPATPEGLLLWAQLLLLWSVVHYGIVNDPVSWPSAATATVSRFKNALATLKSTHGWDLGRVARAVLLIVAAWVLIGIGGRRTVLLVTYVALALLLPTFRGLLASVQASAEWELTITVAMSTFSALVIAGSPELGVAHGIITIGLGPARMSIILVTAAVFIFLGRGGTFVVRGFLEKAGALPKFQEPEKARVPELPVQVRYDATRDVWSIEQQVSSAAAIPLVSVETDSKEINRGRLIGNLERILLTLLAMVGSYPAIAFIITAKGLVRAKEFEKRDYAEYFLIGTLVSAGLALVLGTLIRMLFERYWGSGPL